MKYMFTTSLGFELLRLWDDEGIVCEQEKGYHHAH